MASAEQVVEHLNDVDFPAHRDDLVRAAEQAGAPGDVISALRDAAGGVRQHGRSDEVRPHPAEPDQDPSVKAAQARDKKPHRIAEPLRDVEPTEVHEKGHSAACRRVPVAGSADERARR